MDCKNVYLFNAYRNVIPMTFEQGMLACHAQVMGHHFSNHFVDGDHWLPSKLFFCSARIPKKCFDFGRAEVPGIDLDDHVTNFHVGRRVAIDSVHNSEFMNPFTVELQ